MGITKSNSTDGVKLQDNGNRFLGPSFVTVHEYRTRSQLEISASHANLVETQYFLESGTFFPGMEFFKCMRLESKANFCMDWGT